MEPWSFGVKMRSWKTSARERSRRDLSQLKVNKGGFLFRAEPPQAPNPRKSNQIQPNPTKSDQIQGKIGVVERWGYGLNFLVSRRNGDRKSGQFKPIQGESRFEINLWCDLEAVEAAGGVGRHGWDHNGHVRGDGRS